MHPDQRLSSNGRALLKEYEGVKTKVYVDSAGHPTIGVGHKLTPKELATGVILINGVPIPYKRGLTLPQVEALLTQDLKSREYTVNHYVTVALTQSQFDALVCFVFNIGDAGFVECTLLKLLNKGQYAAVPKQLKRWNKVTVSRRDPKTKVLRRSVIVSAGLVNRRAKEIKLWES